MSTIIFPKCYHLPPPLAGSKTSFVFVMIDSDTPLLVINTNEIDFVEKKCDLEELINKVNSHKIGREYYNPLGS